MNFGALPFAVLVGVCRERLKGRLLELFEAGTPRAVEFFERAGIEIFEESMDRGIQRGEREEGAVA